MNRRGFTLIELLVVISMVVLLMGLLLPALGLARRHARMCRELAAGRQLGQGYLAYAMDHDDFLLPGIANATVKDRGGAPISGQPAHRYPWRLARYVEHGFDGSMYANEQYGDMLRRAEAAGGGQFMRWYMTSLMPSFGYNYYHVGGDALNPANNAPGLLRRLPESRGASRQIVFGSARMNDEAAGQFIAGFERIEAPRGPVRVWEPAFNEALAAEQWGYIDPRWDGRAAFVHLDSHVALMATADMGDMTRWSNEAARLGDSDWKP